jgi:transposase
MIAACKPIRVKEKMNSIGIDVGKRKCRASFKDENGTILDEFFFANDSDGIKQVIRSAEKNGPCRAVVESTGNMWIRLHDTLEEHGINVTLANTLKTKIIAQAKIKSDKLDARILADLLRADLVYESYVPPKEFREKRSLVRHKVALVRSQTMIENRIHSLLDKYEYRTGLSKIFGKSGIQWLKGLRVSPIDKVIMDTSISPIENLSAQIDVVSQEISRYAWESDDVRILLSMTGIDIFAAMVISVEIVDIRRFATPWKLVSYAGMAVAKRESAGKVRSGKITKQGSAWLRWILVQCARVAVMHDDHFRDYYTRIKKRKGDERAIVATAKEMLVISWYMLTRRELYRYVRQERYKEKLSKLEKINQGLVPLNQNE